jgi:prophage regulatory protein
MMGDFINHQRPAMDSIASISDRLLPLRRVMEITSIRKSHIYALMSQGQFPRPVKISARAVAWVEREVSDWVKSRIDARNQLGRGQPAADVQDATGNGPARGANGAGARPNLVHPHATHHPPGADQRGRPPGHLSLTEHHPTRPRACAKSTGFGLVTAKAATGDGHGA